MSFPRTRRSDVSESRKVPTISIAKSVQDPDTSDRRSVGRTRPGMTSSRVYFDTSDRPKRRTGANALLYGLNFDEKLKVLPYLIFEIKP